MHCAVCGLAGAKACARCGLDSYCGKEHQVQDWPRHKQGCGFVALREDSRLGRYVVAAKDIPAGTIVMREVPLVIWPKQEVCVSKAICLGCGRQLGGTPRSVQCCLRCGWPVCGEPCSQRPEHQAECAAFQRAKFKLRVSDFKNLTAWEALATLRVCLATQESPQRWRLLAMQSALPEPGPDTEGPELADMRMTITRGHMFLEERVQRSLRWLTEEAGITWLDVKDLRRAEGLMFVNCMTVEFREWLGCILAGASRLEHSCAPNTDCPSSAAMVGGAVAEGGHVDHDNMEHVVVAGNDLKRGQHLTLSYRAGPFDKKSVRREHLAFRWGFYCRCVLCEDPTQGGLHLDSWHCGLCRGRGEQRLVLVDDGRSWRCEGCGRSGAADDPSSDTACAEALLLERRLLGLYASDDMGERVPQSEWEDLIRDALWPRGPMHATSSLVLLAKDAVTKTPSDASSLRALSSVFSAGTADPRGDRLRELLAAVSALGYGSHNATRFLRQVRLFEHVTVALGCKLQSPSARQRWQQQQMKALRKEGQELLKALQKAAVVPFDKEKVRMHAQDFQSVSIAF